MFNLTTHSGANGALRREYLPISRIGPRAFGALVVVELLVLVAVLVWALIAFIPPATPLAATHSLTPVQEAIRERVGGAVADPLVEIQPGLSARASNLRGFRLDGATYYYYIEGAANFDPFSRGVVNSEQIEVLLRDSSGPATVVIYRLL